MPSAADDLGHPRAAYFVGFLGRTGRELAHLVLRCADDAQVVAWARRLVARRDFPMIRVERRGSLRRRLPGAR
ncbi:MAG TPA: hypothetical protein VFE13_08640 [Caulobacteraceae bacterium]|nr:hypothetical protein [Caulobacteraceae bacterium]